MWMLESNDPTPSTNEADPAKQFEQSTSIEGNTRILPRYVQSNLPERPPLLRDHISISPSLLFFFK